MCRGYLFIICSSRGRQFSSVPKALLLVAGHPAHHLYFYYYCYYYFIVSSKWGNSDMMRIFVYEDNPLFGPFPLAFWRDGWTEQGIIYNCLFPLWPVECSLWAGWVAGWFDVELSKHSSPYPGKKLKQLGRCKQNTYEDMFRNFKKTFMFGLILTPGLEGFWWGRPPGLETAVFLLCPHVVESKKKQALCYLFL